MTKYKEYLKAHGVRVQCDYEAECCYGIVEVATKVLDNGVAVGVHHESMGCHYAVYNRSGDCSYFNQSDFEDYMEDSCWNPEFCFWMCDTDCKISSTLFTVAVGMYKNDEKVRLAFRHMRAGIMDEKVFYQWLVKQYSKHIRSV